MMQDFLGPFASGVANDGSFEDDEVGDRNRTDGMSPSTTTMPFSSFTLRIRRVDDEGRKRHRTDFVVLKLLGIGGFGKVYKVRNKLDSKCYALKVVPMPECTEPGGATMIPSSTFKKSGAFSNKIDAPSSSALSHVLREVEILSSIPSNDNVVRYYAAWVEKTRDENDVLHCHESEFCSGGGDSYDQFIESGSSSMGCNSFDRSNTTYTDSDAGLCTIKHRQGPVCHLCKASYDDWEVGLEYWGLIDSVLQPLDLCVECYTQSLPEHVDTSKMNVRKVRPYRRRLYILMEYCDATLDKAMKNSHKQKIEPKGNSEVDKKDDYANDRAIADDEFVAQCWSYFRQTVKGVAHLHANGIVHRDIKPNNVFLVNEGVAEGIVKIGDLGLATIDATTATTHHGNTNTSSTKTKEGDDVNRSSASVKQSSNVGTYLYRAPEVTTGKYNEKCDVYSLGILLFEIFGNFETAMERAKVLGDLKDQFSTLNTELLVTDKKEEDSIVPFYTRLAHRMIAPNPNDRPSCAEILDELEHFWLFRSRGSTPSFSSSHISDNSLDNDLLREKDREIARLKKLLTDHGIPFEEDTTVG